MSSNIYWAVYILTILGACLASISRSLSHDKMLFFISGYLMSNFLTELIILFILPRGMYNHFVLATNLAVSQLFLCLYFFRLTRKPSTRIFNILGCVIITGSYLYGQMWRFQTIMGINFVSAYYVLISLITLFVLWDLLVTEKRNDARQFAIRLIAVLGSYHVLMFINTACRFFEQAVSDKDLIYMITATWILNLTYYSALTVMLIRSPKTNAGYAS